MFVLNTVHDRELSRAYASVLTRAEDEGLVAGHTTVDFNQTAYCSAKTHEERVRWAININEARNVAIEAWRGTADYVLVLDGDCFVEKTVWRKVVATVEQGRNYYYSLPSVRCPPGEILPQQVVAGEPMVMFRCDAELRFNPELPFGIGNDKQELLSRLGHNLQNFSLRSGAISRITGRVLHLATGEEKTESNLNERMRLRNESVAALLARLDRK